MITHYLNSFFKPESVAVFGANPRLESVGSRVLSNLVTAGFRGVIFPVNPRYDHLRGLLCYPNIAAIGRHVDLAVVATPSETVPDILEQCGAAGTRAAIVLSSGFGEIGEKGKELEKKTMEVARRHHIRVLGPNCVGLIQPSQGLNATFGKSQALAGGLGLVSQSGALCTAILDWAEGSKVGFSTVVSLGDAIDLDFGEVLDYLATDAKTRSILLYIEGLRDARRFLSSLRSAARMKPVIVMKPGRYPAASRAAISHTGAIVGADDVFDAALDRAGVVRVDNLRELFSAATTLSMGISVKGKRLGVVTNGGGPGVIAADVASERGLVIPDLSEETTKVLNHKLPAHWSHGNPVDLLGDAGVDRYRIAVERCMDDANIDGVLVILTPQAMTEPEEVARTIVEIWKSRKGPGRKPLIACWMGKTHVESSHVIFGEEGIPAFRTPESAVTAFAHLWQYHRNQDLLLEVPGPLTDQTAPDIEGGKQLIENALNQGRTQLSILESKELLAKFHIPVAEVRPAATVEEAVEIAKEMGFPVVMKINSPNLSHKSDVGGVELNLRDPWQVAAAFPKMLKEVATKAPDAELQGVTIERQWEREHTRELLVGVLRDPVFGPAITFGWGGTAVEVLGDRAVCLPPLNEILIRRMISRTRVARMLGPFRNLPPIDGKVLETVLLRLSEMVCELPWIEELEINPLSCDEADACALDVQIKVTRDVKEFRATAPGQLFGHMAIPPYPKHLAKKAVLPSGGEITVRPVRPEDAEIERDFVNGLSKEAKYFRFMQALQKISPEMLVRYTQIDYDREMAFLASVPEDGSEREIGIARYVINPDGKSCEFAVVVGDEWQGRGVGTILMSTLMDEARTKQIKRMDGQVLVGNHNMLAMMSKLGFKIGSSEDSLDIKEVSLDL